MSQVRVKMPEGTGCVTVGGVEIKPDVNRCVLVTHDQAAELVSHGGEIVRDRKVPTPPPAKVPVVTRKPTDDPPKDPPQGEGTPGSDPTK